MIVDVNRRIGIFLVPGTGTKTLIQLFRDNVSATYIKHRYSSIDEACLIFAGPDYNVDPLDFMTYKFYAFYREPIERVVSCRSDLYRAHLWDMSGDKLDDFFTRNNYQLLRNVYVPFYRQTHWIDHNIDLELLDFRNYESEVRKLLGLFNVTVPTVPEQIEETSGIPYVPFNYVGDELTTVQSLYQQDYDFLTSKGISFV